MIAQTMAAVLGVVAAGPSDLFTVPGESGFEERAAPRGAEPTAEEAAAPTVIFSNFSDGTTTLVRGKQDDATTNTSAYCAAAPYSAWTGNQSRKVTLQNALQGMMKDFNVVLAAQRPYQGPYVMIMVGPPSKTCSNYGAAGVADLDCGNRNPSNVVFDFDSAGSAITMAQEVAHSFGLSHVDVACDVMGAGYSHKACASGNWGYPDVEGPTLGTTACSMNQNSYQLMLSVLGAWPGGPKPDPMGDGCSDGADPTVSFAEPMDGATVGNSFTVRAEASDDCAVKEVRIDVPAQNLTATATTAPFEWNLTNVADADDLEMSLTVSDRAGHQASAKVHVRVMAGAGGNDTDAGATDDAGGTGADAPGADGGSSGGCHCAITSGRPSGRAGGLLALLAVAALARRRRR